MKKLYDLAVKTGSFQNREGVTKNKYLNVGAVMEDNEGGKFMFLERTFNPAGVPFKENSNNIIISMFKPKTEQTEPTGLDNTFPAVEDMEIAF